MKEWYESQLTTTWLRKYFSFQGRICRRTYIIRILISLVIVVVLRMIFDGGFRAFAGQNDFISLMAKVIDLGVVWANMLCGLALFAKRLHDFDKDGSPMIKINLWLGTIGNCLAIGLLLFMYTDFYGAMQFVESMAAVIGIFNICLLPWGLYCLYWGICSLFKKGTLGPNRFGEISE